MALYREVMHQVWMARHF